MHVLLVPFGSHGDVHPFIGLAKELRARGHRVTFILNDYFGPLVRGLGFEQVPLEEGDAVRFTETLRNPDLWHPRKAFGFVMKAVLEGAERVYDRVAERYMPGETVAVGGSLAFGVRLAEEKLGV